MNTTIAYRQFAAQREVPLFFRPQWLDLFTRTWKVISAELNGNALYFVYRVEKKLGFRIIRNPFLTPYYGFVFDGNMEQAPLQQLVREVLVQLPASDEFHMDLWPQLPVDLEFPGFVTFKKITNLLELTSKDVVYNNYKPALKRQIRKGEKHIEIRSVHDIELFYTLHRKTFEKQDMKTLTPFDAFEKAWNLCKREKCGELFFAFDAGENCHAALFLAYDTTRAYYLAGGSDPGYYGSGAMSYLMHHAIMHSVDMGKRLFDFEGSMLPGVNRFFKNFSPVEVAYTTLVKMDSTVLKFIKAVKKKTH